MKKGIIFHIDRPYHIKTGADIHSTKYFKKYSQFVKLTFKKYIKNDIIF